MVYFCRHIGILLQTQWYTTTNGHFYRILSTSITININTLLLVPKVAVLSIFAEVGVNPHLYFLVFGESLLNDGVAVVLYNMMKTFAGLEHAGRAVTAADLLLGCCSFLTVAVGGLAVGLVCGLLTSLLTRATRGLRIIEPLALFCGGYL